MGEAGQAVLAGVVPGMGKDTAAAMMRIGWIFGDCRVAANTDTVTAVIMNWMPAGIDTDTEEIPLFIGHYQCQWSLPSACEQWNIFCVRVDARQDTWDIW